MPSTQRRQITPHVLHIKHFLVTFALTKRTRLRCFYPVHKRVYHYIVQIIHVRRIGAVTPQVWKSMQSYFTKRTIMHALFNLLISLF